VSDITVQQKTVCKRCCTLEHFNADEVTHSYTSYVRAPTSAPYKFSSQRVNKLRILPIRKIQKLLILQLNVARLRPNIGFLLILHAAIEIYETQVTKTDTLFNGVSMRNTRSKVSLHLHSRQ
jgi:hypothetical protein